MLSNPQLNARLQTAAAALAESPQQPVPLLQQTLADAQRSIRSRFAEGGAPETLLADYAGFMDGIMTLAWQTFPWEQGGKFWRRSRISLLAVGGYGREELLPHSDIDLLILLEGNHYNRHDANIQGFLALLWDLGLRVGHSVRSIKECRKQARQEVTVLTALMESRTLIGAEALRQKMNRQIAPSKSVWPSKAFFHAKRAEQQARHVKSDHTESSLEPNVKTSPGGLRDIQTLMWIAKRQYGTQTFADLVREEVLTQEEADELTRGQRFLWKIRFALHCLASKDENRLSFDYQQELASQFGYKDGNQLAVEQFMQDYYRTTQRINTINDIALQYFDEAIVRAKDKLATKAINERFRLVDNYLEVCNENVFRQTPSALLEMFVIAGEGKDIKGIRAATIRLARRSVPLIDEGFRRDPINAGLFMQLLGVRYHLFSQLRRMGRYGILGAYLPEFGRVIGQMQFDLFHIYTVDAHTLQVVRNMRRFRYKDNEQRFPIAAQIHASLPRVELLYIAGLYHDIAKGMGGDHSELGVNIAKRFCERHGLAEWETNLVCWLVLNHLVMSTTAQRKDIQDPEVVQEFAQLVGDPVRLDYLYALTVADINATNPSLWNGWRASLLRHLYLDTKRVLRQGEDKQVDRHAYVQNVQQLAISRLAERGIEAARVTALWRDLGDEYFLRERMTDLVEHTEAVLAHQLDNQPDNQPDKGPLVMVQDVSRRTDTGFTQIFVHTPSRQDLFVAIVTAIDALRLDIVDAGIATSATGLTFNTFTVLEADGLPVGDKPARVDEIRATLAAYLGDKAPKRRYSRRTPLALKQFRMKTEVSCHQAEHPPQTMLEVVAPDRPGLLALVAKVFVEFNVSLTTARITTLGERVEDIFYISDEAGGRITDARVLAQLSQRICEELDQAVEQTAA